MKRKKLLIIVQFQNLREEGPYFAPTPAPPLPGLLLAGMTPDVLEVEVLHEMARPIAYGTDADFVALSFMDYLAPRYDRHRVLGWTAAEEDPAGMPARSPEAA